MAYLQQDEPNLPLGSGRQLRAAQAKVREKRRHNEQAYVGYWLAQKGRIGTWQSNHDQGSLPPNPAQSTVLRLRKTAIRNEETSPWLSKDGAGGQAVCHDEGRWGKKPMPWCNATDMLTYPRFVGR